MGVDVQPCADRLTGLARSAKGTNVFRAELGSWDMPLRGLATPLSHWIAASFWPLSKSCADVASKRVPAKLLISAATCAAIRRTALLCDCAVLRWAWGRG
jgi:hypothetical protein